MNDTTHTPADQQSRVRALLADAAAHYRATLREAPRAVAYLRKRGISGAGAARYGIGFAAPGWHELDAILAQHDLATIEASGLQVFKDGDQPRRFDRFRDRIMFPIRDVSGEIRGFGGRILVESDTAPKYMNSPEGPNFKKRELLYGLYEAQAAIEAEDMALVVEGYLDVVSLAQAGFLPVVGSLGTACTADQIGALLTRATRLVFSFDGDAAGRRAAAAALATVLPFAVDANRIEFLFLPAEHDPDSFVRANGLDAFKTELAKAVPLASYLQQIISEGCNFDHAEGRSLCASRARAYWDALPDGHCRDELVAYCCRVTRFTEAELLDVWRLTRG